MTIPVFLNRGAGTADAVREAVGGDARFALHAMEGREVSDAVARAVRDGAARVAVAGGDGTVAGAASHVVNTNVTLAIVPAGTLNHFARALGIPVEAADAANVAAGADERPVDVGYVGERLFLNTSAVGAYVAFVRLRERLEPRLGYRLASLVAGLRLFWHLPRYEVQLEVEGTRRAYVTPLVFVGVGEREVAADGFGARVADGRDGLHVIVVRGHRRARLLALGLAAARAGAPGVARMPEVDSFVVDRCTVAVRRTRAWVATDGEVTRMAAPLQYRIDRGALRVAAPPPAAPAASTARDAEGRA